MIATGGRKHQMPAESALNESIFVLSAHAKHAIRAAVAVVIAYGIALYMDWGNPVWSGYTAASITLDITGQSIQKGLNRISGAICGSLVGFVLLAFFIQDRWLFFTFLSIYLAISVYLSMGTEKYNYFWQQAGFFAVVVGLSTAFTPNNAFGIAVERVQGASTGLLVVSIVGLVLWPSSSRGSLMESLRQLVSGLQKLFQKETAEIQVLGDTGGLQEFGTQLVSLQTRFNSLLDAAEVDSWEVDEMRHAWRRCQAQIADLINTMEQCSQDFYTLRDLDLEEFVANLTEFNEEIDARFTQVARMLAGDAPEKDPLPITPRLDGPAVNTLPHFDRAALTVALEYLEHLEKVTGALFASVREIMDFGAAASAPPRAKTPFIVDRDRLEQAFRVTASAWLAFLVIIYVPGVPGELGAAALITRIVVADTKFAWIPIPSFIFPIVVSLLFAFPIYVFLMPMMSSFVELALLLFAVVFLVHYHFREPKQMLMRVMLVFLFLSVADIKNVQEYDFMQFANTGLKWSLLIVLLTMTEYFPVSQQPDHVFLRMLGRFFRGCEGLTASLEWAPDRGSSLRSRWKKRFHAHEVSTLPGKLATWGRYIQPSARGGTKPEQLQSLATSLQTLAFRAEELTRARSFQQSPILVGHLLDDMRRWRISLQEIFARLAEQPQAEEAAALQTRLSALLARLETRIKDTLDEAEPGEYSAAESKNMYRLLGAQRGLSEALVDFVNHAQGIDWSRLAEERF